MRGFGIIYLWTSLTLSSCLRLLYHRSFPHHHEQISGKMFRPTSSAYLNFQARDNMSMSARSMKVSESGAALEIQGVNLSIGNNDIIGNINWTIMPNERWALVGKNGAGKSTLLKALTNTGGETLSIRDGFIAVAKKARMGYLEQKGVSGSTKTVRAEVSSRMEKLQLASARLEAAEKRVAAGDTSDIALELLEEAVVGFELAGGYIVDQKIANVLQGLGFLESDFDRLCAEFSGGWQMRIALARLLLSEPDLLLLDEPTNHLDKGAREWLGRFLSNYDGTLLIVSHDTHLLNTAANSIAEVRAGTIELYKSRSHAQWLVEREERVRNAEAQFEANQKEITRLQTFVDRFGAKTMGASMAQSKLKTIEKLRESGPQQVPVAGDGPLPVLKLPVPPRGSKDLLELRDVTLGWAAIKATDATAAEAEEDKAYVSPADNIMTNPSLNQQEKQQHPPVILSKCNIHIERGMRIAVRGPNGAGKSTLLSALAGKLTPLSGERLEGDGLALGVFTQDLAQDLDQTARALDVVTQLVQMRDPAGLSDQRARAALGALGLQGEKALRLVGHLSGGEKARVALASFVLIPHNLLLLDEVLTKALRTFAGAVLVISHDRGFLQALEPTHVMTVRDGSVRMEERSLREADWNDPLDSRTVISTPSSSSSASSTSSPTPYSPSINPSAPPPLVSSSIGKAAVNREHHQGSPGKGRRSNVASGDSGEVAGFDRKKALNAPRRIKKVENSIEKLQAEMATVDEEMLQHGRDVSRLVELQVVRDKLQGRVDGLYAELEDLLPYV